MSDKYINKIQQDHSESQEQEIQSTVIQDTVGYFQVHIQSCIGQTDTPIRRPRKRISKLTPEVRLGIEIYQPQSEHTSELSNIHESPIVNKILSFPETFNPKESLTYIKTQLFGNTREKALTEWKKSFQKQIDTLAEIPTLVKHVSETKEFLGVSEDEIINKTLAALKLYFKKLSVEQRIETIKRVQTYLQKVKIVKQYSENPRYAKNPKQLLADITDIDIRGLQGKIIMETKGAYLIFYVHNEATFCLIASDGDEDMAMEIDPSWGFTLVDVEIADLNNTVAIIRASDNRKEALLTELHESRHLDNAFIMPDAYMNHENDLLAMAKDEILAFLAQKERFSNIQEQLLAQGPWALYDFYEEKSYNENDLPKEWFESKYTMKKLYKQDLKRSLKIAKKMKQANIPNYIEILAIFPIRQWSHLESIYFKKDI